MKKLFAIVFTVLMLMSLSANVFAADNVNITTSIEPTHTVTIPANTSVAFNATKTAFGAIQAEAAQIHPDKCIKVTLSSDGKLENSIDATKVIPYVIKDAAGNTFTSATYLAAGEKTELSIHTTAADWKAAYAGDYADTVTFNVSYEDKV